MTKMYKRMNAVDAIIPVKDFRDHVMRLRTQYKEILTLKEKLPEHVFLLQMDFTENYMCRSVDEVQSAYWHQTAVTLHPVVAYYRDIDRFLQHNSYVVISDEMAHTAIIEGII